MLSNPTISLSIQASRCQIGDYSNKHHVSNMLMYYGQNDLAGIFGKLLSL